MTEMTRPNRAVMPGTGEEIDLTDMAQVAAASNMASRMMGMLRTLKETTDALLRDELQTVAETTVMLGDVEVTEETGKATYDAETIYQAAVQNGVSAVEAEKHFYWERKVADGKELNKLANRQEAWRGALAAGTKRSRGRIVTKRKAPTVGAPATPKGIQDAASSLREAEAEASSLGI